MQPFFIPNISSENDPIYFDCDDSFDQKVEVTKYFIQFFYLLFGAYLNFSILYTIQWKNREIYSQNPFFMLFSMDCTVNLILILCDLFFARFFIYFTPACPYLKDFFSSPLIFFKLIMIVIHHCKVCKSLFQSLLVLNRMTCVLLPISHSATWRQSLPFIIPSVLIIPLSVDWNLAISRVYMMPTYGGFWVNYIKKISWASQSRFQLIFLIIALSATFICTLITLYTLIMLETRIKELEKSITYATVITSCGFGTVGVFQVLFSFFSFNTIVTSVFAWNNFGYDFLNVGSPLVMLCVSRSVRENVFEWTRTQKELDAQVFPVSITATKI